MLLGFLLISRILSIVPYPTFNSQNDLTPQCNVSTVASSLQQFDPTKVLSGCGTCSHYTSNNAGAGNLEITQKPAIACLVLQICFVRKHADVDQAK